MKRKTKNKKTPKQGYTPEQQEMDADLDNYSALAAVAESEGGKIIIDSAVSDILSAMSLLSTSYKGATHAELMSWCAELSAKLSLVQMLVQSEGQKDAVATLLKESLVQSQT